MRRALPLSLSAVTLAAAVASVPAAEVLSISDYGSDGEETYYQVTCGDNSTGSVTVRADPPQICTTPAVGEPQCKESWSVRLAAIQACK